MAQRRTEVQRSLREFYKLGHRVLRADKQSTSRGEGKRNWGVFDKMHEETGFSRTEIEKARLFARQYTAADFGWFCRLCSDKGKPLTKSHLMSLLAVPHEAKRRKLAEKTAKEGWSVQRLQAEIARGRIKRSRGGLRPHRPRSVQDALVQIEFMSGRWLKWHEVLQATKGEDTSVGISLNDLPDPMQTLLAKITDDMEILHAEVRKQLLKTDKKKPVRTRKNRKKKR